MFLFVKQCATCIKYTWSLDYLSLLFTDCIRQLLYKLRYEVVSVNALLRVGIVAERINLKNFLHVWLLIQGLVTVSIDNRRELTKFMATLFFFCFFLCVQDLRRSHMRPFRIWRGVHAGPWRGSLSHHQSLALQSVCSQPAHSVPSWSLAPIKPVPTVSGQSCASAVPVCHPAVWPCLRHSRLPTHLPVGLHHHSRFRVPSRVASHGGLSEQLGQHQCHWSFWLQFAKGAQCWRCSLVRQYPGWGWALWQWPRLFVCEAKERRIVLSMCVCVCVLFVHKCHM